MSIDTYATLKTAVANLLNRGDLGSRIPEFIVGAETRIFRGSQEAPFESEPLRIRSMEQSSYTTLAAQAVALPTLFLQARRLYLSGNAGRKLSFIDPDEFWTRYVGTTSGTPLYFTIEGENLLVGPTPDTSYTAQLLYYKAFAALSADADTNWLLTNAPYAYVHGAAIEGFRYLRNPDAMASSHAAFCGIINALNLSDKRDRYSGSPWAAKTDFNPP